MSVNKNEFSNTDVLDEKKENFDNFINNAQIANNAENDVEKKEESLTTELNDNYIICSENKSRNPILYVVFIIISILILIIASIICFNIFYKKIFFNTFIAGIDVSNLSKEEAINKLNEELLPILDREIILKQDENEYKLNIKDIEPEFNISQVVEEAYRVGRGSNLLNNNLNMLKSIFLENNFNLELSYNEEKLDEIIKDIASNYNSLVQSSYQILDDKIIIKKGSQGIEVKEEELKTNIVNALTNKDTNIIIIGVIIREPDVIDIDAIHEEIYKAPVDAYYTTNPFKIYKEENGLDFDMTVDEAKALLETDQEEYVIGLKVLKPSVTTSQIGDEAFPDLLATCSTSYIASKIGRTTNLKLASSKINNYVLMPGETFSYNKVVGERTAEAGFQLAGVYSGGQEVQGLGGGICQISSTLYNIVVKSNLEIVERENHMFLPGYLPAGQDATVVYGSIDFKFKNTRDYPVKIVSTVSGGYVTMKMYGKKEKNEPQISFETVYHQTIYPKVIYKDTTSLAPGVTKVESYGQNGCKSSTYKVVKQNGTVVSRTLLSEDTYSAQNKVILRGVEKK